MVKIKVSQGWLEGETLDLVTGDGKYYSFKGIPYAAPPVGKLRFKAPQPPLPWEGIRKAISHGAECPQIDIFQNNKLIPGNEDCLFLNVYTRDLTPRTPLPVMVFIHGGGFQSGSGNDREYGPDFLVNHGVLLVTINYRLDVLGFLCLDTKDVPGNAGLKDQVAALRWVKENIKNFGGNPDNVTVFGESAGGASTAFHVLSPMSKGLFRRAISMSGVPSCDWSQAYHPKRRAFLLGKILGKDTSNPDELLEFLQSVPAEKLVGQDSFVLTSEEFSSKFAKMYDFTPVVEKNFGGEHFITEPSHEILKKGTFNDVDLLIGHTSEELVLIVAALNSKSNGNENTALDVMANQLIERYNRYPEMVVPRKIMVKCTPDTILNTADRIHKYYFRNRPINETTIKEFVKYMSESCFLYDIHGFAEKLSLKKRNKLFFYLFSCLSSRNFFDNNGAKYDIHGAAHLDDLLYVFDPKHMKMPVDKNSREYKMVRLVNTVFTNFAKYGTPTPDTSLGLTWPEYKNSDKMYVNIADDLTLKENYKPDEMAFWKKIFKDAGVEY